MNKKKIAVFVIIFGIVAVLFNGLSILWKKAEGANLYMSLAFGDATLLLTLCTIVFADKKNNWILILSPLKISLILSAVSCVINFLFIICGLSNIIANAVINAIICLVFISCFLVQMFFNADTQSNTNQARQDAEFLVRNKNMLRLFMGKSASEVVNKHTEKIYDALNSAQVLKNVDTSDIDDVIEAKITEYVTLIEKDAESTEIISVCNEILTMILNRNMRIASAK